MAPSPRPRGRYPTTHQLCRGLRIDAAERAFGAFDVGGACVRGKRIRDWEFFKQSDLVTFVLWVGCRSDPQ